MIDDNESDPYAIYIRYQLGQTQFLAVESLDSTQAVIQNLPVPPPIILPPEEPFPGDLPQLPNES